MSSYTLLYPVPAVNDPSADKGKYSMVYPVPLAISTEVTPIQGTSTTVASPTVESQGKVSNQGTSTVTTQPEVIAEGLVYEVGTISGSSTVTTQPEVTTSGNIKVKSSTTLTIAKPEVPSTGSIKLSGAAGTVIVSPTVVARTSYGVPASRYVPSVAYRYKLNETPNRRRDVSHYNKLYRNVKKAHRANRFLYVPETGQPIPEFYIGQDETLNFAIKWDDILGDERITNSVWRSDVDIDRSDYIREISVVYIWGNPAYAGKIGEVTNYIQTNQGNSYSLTFYVMVK
jgi:hypothetical protein